LKRTQAQDATEIEEVMVMIEEVMVEDLGNSLM